MSLNDPQWGRGSQNNGPDNEKKDESAQNERNNDQSNDRQSRSDKEQRQTPRDHRERPQDDLDQLWNDFNKTINSILGGRKRGSQSRSDRSQNDSRDRGDWNAQSERNGEGGNLPPNAGRHPSFFKDGQKGASWGVSVFFACLLLGWLATGFYIVPEGQTGVVTTFGRYSQSAMPGFRWHLPLPIQNVQIVDVSSVRTTEIGASGRSDRLREALMLTDDENIVDVQFTVQYRIKPGNGAKDFIFNTRNPDQSVVQAAESAMREVVGRKAMDSVLFESKQEIAEAVKKSMQDMLDRYGTGIEVMSVAIQNAQPPQQVQAAFNDAVKAGQDRERQINEGQAYSNAVIPKARGAASRLTEEAEGYKARVVENARGDADRFSQVYAEYAKAPKVTRDRLYVDTMRDILTNASKVYVDNKNSNNLLYLPLDRLIGDTQKAARAQMQDSSLSADSTSTFSASSSGANVPARSDSSTVRLPNRTTNVDSDPRELLRERTR